MNEESPCVMWCYIHSSFLIHHPSFNLEFSVVAAVAGASAAGGSASAGLFAVAAVAGVSRGVSAHDLREDADEAVHLSDEGVDGLGRLHDGVCIDHLDDVLVESVRIVHSLFRLDVGLPDA